MDFFMSYDANAFTLLNLISIISKRIKLLILIPLFSTVLMIIYVFVKPEIFLGKATILPAPSMTTGISLSKLAGFDISGLGMGGQLTNLFRYQTIIESRRIADSVISKYQLMELYETRFYSDCLKAYYSNLGTFIDEELGALYVTFKYPRDPNKAAEITNYIIDLMVKINRELSVSLATSQKKYIEKRYFEALEKIQLLEDSLKQFQISNDIILIEEQSKLTLQALAELKVKILENEVQYNLLKEELGSQHPKTKAQLAIIQELKKQFDIINAGFSADKFYIPKKEINELAFHFLRLKKELEINYKIQEFLVPQYELAKIAVIRDTPDVQVLDYAIPPDRKIAPKRMIMTLITFIFSTTLTLILIVILEYSKNLKADPKHIAKVQEIKMNIRGLFKKK